MSIPETPVVGVAACVFKNNQLLLGRRKKHPGMNSWQCPGGLLNLNESVFECARQHIMHKTGLNTHNLRYGPYTNNRFVQHDFHSVTLYVAAEYLSGDIDATKYEQAEDWQWFNLDQMPEPLFLPLAHLQKKHSEWLQSFRV